MQSLAIIKRDFSQPPFGLKYYGDLQLYQIKHLPCLKNTIDNKYNNSIFHNKKQTNKENVIDFIFENYFIREGKNDKGKQN